LVLPDMFCGARIDRKPSFHTQNTHFIMFLNVLSVLSVLSVLCLFSLPAVDCHSFMAPNQVRRKSIIPAS
jgi:hypothetical protein